MLKQIIEIIIKYKGFFSLDQVIKEAHSSTLIAHSKNLNLRAEVKHRLDRLEAEGLIKRSREMPGKKVKRPGGPAPKEILYIKCKGLSDRLSKMTIQRRAVSWDKIWRTIRVMRRVTTTDLIQLTGVGEDNVRAFLKILRRDGWVRKVGKGPAGLVIWALVKDPGPERPRIPMKPHSTGSGF